VTSERQQCEVAISAVTVLRVDKDADMRTALRDLLEHVGYAVAEAESLHQAEPLLDATLTPLVLIVGDAEAVEQVSLRYFTAVAANPMTKHTYTYLFSAPPRWRLPSLVEALRTMETPTVDLPYELSTFLAVVADAARRACG
jgi:DNA-binding NtrC family response regulator